MALTRPRIGQLITSVAQTSDPITVLHSGSSAADVDVGFLINRANGLLSNVALYWNETAGSFTTAFTSNSGAIDSNISVTSYAPLTSGNITSISSVAASATYTTANVSGYQLGMYVNNGLGSLVLGFGTNTSPGTFMTLSASGGKNYLYTANRDFYISDVSSNQWLYLTQANGNTSINSTTSSTSTTTGALVVKGGVGVAGAVYAGGAGSFAGGVITSQVTSNQASIRLYNDTQSNIAIGGTSTAVNILSTATSTNSTSGALIVSGGVGVAGATNLGGTLSVTGTSAYTGASTFGSTLTASGNIVAASGTASTNTTTGALVVNGGVGISGSVYTSANVNTTDSFVASGLVVASGNIVTQSNVNASAINSSGNISLAGVLSVGSALTSTSATTGALVVKGGAGFGGDVYISGNLSAAQLNSTITNQLSITAPLVYLSANAYPYNFDMGFYSHFIGGPANVYAHTGMARSYASNQWGFFSNVRTEPSGTVNWNDAGIIWDTVKAGALVLANSTASTSTTTGALQVSGGVGIGGSLYIANAGDVSANLGAYQTYANTQISSTQANLGAYQTYANTQIQTINANLGSYQTYANTQIQSINANLGSYQTTLNANLGAYQTYANTQISSTQANLGAYQTYANTQLSLKATASTPTFTGTVTSQGPVVINDTTTSTSTTTGALKVAGGAGIVGNAFVDKVYVTNGLYWAANGYTISTGGGGAASGSTGAVQFNDSGIFGGAALYYWKANATVTAPGAVYVGSMYDSGNRVVSTSSGTANLSISGTGINLTAHGPGPTTVGNTTTIPVITTDAYGRVSALTSASISTTLSVAGGTGTGTVSLASQSLTIAGGTGITTSASGQTITVTNSGVTGLSSSGTGNLTVSASTGAVTVSLPATGPGATTVGSSSAIPVITTDAYGRITALTTSAISIPTASTLTGTTLNSTIVSSSLTSVGTLTSLAVSGSTTRNSRSLITNYTGTSAPSSPQQGDEWYNSSSDIMYKYIYDGTNYEWVDQTSPLYNSATTATANTLALRDSSGDLYAVTFRGKATSAQYADLAENYLSDANYAPGTVVVFGGEKEITVTTQSHDTRVAGVISTNPAYLMNDACEGLPVAFTGRVPCLVQGPITKGDVLVTSTTAGVAQRIGTNYQPGCVIGKALENITTNEITTIEVVVGRF
jgi:hypothetical protein